MTRVKDAAYAVHAALGLTPKPHRVTTERMRAALWGLRLHRPKAIDVPILVIEAVDGLSGRSLEAWQRHTTATCEVRLVPGDHHSVLAPPHVDAVVDAISAALASVRQPEPHEVA